MELRTQSSVSGAAGGRETLGRGALGARALGVGAAQRLSTCPACAKPWVPALAPENKSKKRERKRKRKKKLFVIVFVRNKKIKVPLLRMFIQFHFQLLHKMN